MLDFRALPLRLAATLAFGLPPESRSKMKLIGEEIPLEKKMQAAMVDSLRHVDWVLCGAQGKAPSSLLSVMAGEQEDGGMVQSFDSPEEFDAAMRAIERRETDGEE